MLTLFLLTFAIVTAAVLAMAAGRLLSGRCLRGSCGGLAELDADGEPPCAHCPFQPQERAPGVSARRSS